MVPMSGRKINPTLPVSPGRFFATVSSTARAGGVALRQWHRVTDSVPAHQDDQLIIAGSPVIQGTQHVLMAQSCLSLLPQRAQQQAQQQPAETTS